MCDFSLLLGSETVSWYAELAFRSLVSRSATGSVIVMMDVSLFSSGFDIRYANADLVDRCCLVELLPAAVKLCVR